MFYVRSLILEIASRRYVIEAYLLRGTLAIPQLNDLHGPDPMGRNI